MKFAAIFCLSLCFLIIVEDAYISVCLFVLCSVWIHLNKQTEVLTGLMSRYWNEISHPKARISRYDRLDAVATHYKLMLLISTYA